MNLHVAFLSVASAFLATTWCAAASGQPTAPAVVNPTDFLEPGEVIVLRMGWGIFTHAGETRFETTAFESPEGRRLRVRVNTESKGLVDAIYPISTNSELILDPQTGRTLVIETTGKEGKRPVHATTRFDYEQGKVIHVDHERPGRSGTVELPEETIYDLMVTVLKVRSWRLEPGQSRRVQCIVEDDIYDLEITALRAGRVKTPAGTFEAVEIEPKQMGELKGFFRKGGSMKFWISRDQTPQIVRIDFKTKAGTISASLASVTKPSAADAHPRP